MRPLVRFHEDFVMRSSGWFQASRRIATWGALLALASVAGCSAGPTGDQVNAGMRTAAALSAQAWAQYFAVVRAASRVRVNGGFQDLGELPVGELYPCPKPITAPIQPASPGEYSPRQEYVISLALRGGTSPDNGQLTHLQAAISDLELGLRHEAFGRFSLDRNDPGYHLAWRGSGRVEVTTFSDFPDYPPAGVYILIVSRCGQFDPTALPDLITWLRKNGPPPTTTNQLRGGLPAGRRGHRARTR
jgi:hypothetical protein